MKRKVNINDEISHRRRALAQAASQAQRDKESEHAHAETVRQQELRQRDEIAQLAARFQIWAKQSGIKPTKMRRWGDRSRRKVKGWPLVTYSRGPIDYDNPNNSSPKTLMLLSDGTAEWSPTEASLNHSFAVSRLVGIYDVRAGIIEFIANSSSDVAWPE